MIKTTIIPAALLAGTIIGAGIFALPYVSTKAGIVVASAAAVLFTALMVSIHTMYADVVADIGHQHRFAGVAKKYMGKKGYTGAIAMTIVHMLFVLAIYILFAVDFFKIILPPEWSVYGAILFWMGGSIAAYMSVRAVSIVETIAVVGMMMIVGMVVIYGITSDAHASIPVMGNSIVSLLVPFGVILFALNGRPAIPSVVAYGGEEGERKKRIRKAIIIGTISAALVYVLFVIGVIGASEKVTQDTISGLMVPAWAQVLLGVLGILAVITSYIAVAQDVKKSLEYDVSLSSWIAGIVTVFIPVAIYMAHLGSLVQLLEVVGGIFVSLEGLMIIYMWNKHKKESNVPIAGKIPSWWMVIMRGVFVVSMVYVFYEIIIKIIT